ncbi:MAG: protein kinase [Gemmatimonadota bacterium]
MDHLTKLQSALADRYTVVREIGAGGMATVFLARDVRHERQVALKLLKPELGAILGADRFLSEIRVTANLQHPHLLPLFDSGEADGLLFYVMPYVEGESLRARLDREKQLPVDEAIRITVAAASALDYAHRHGVVHRDLKPENILLHDGQPLVSDFGIALAVSNAGGARVTQTGLSLGTPAYMSPEQATGDRSIDARSDIYSLAAVLHEMLSGEPPHTGASVQAIIARVLTDKVRSVRTARDTVPVHVDAAMQKALAKLPADRFATALQFADALTNPRAVVAAEDAYESHVSVVPTRTAPWTAAAVPWLIAAVGLAIGASSLMRKTAPVTVPTSRFAIALPSGVERPAQQGAGIGVSPDGRTIVFAGMSNGRYMLFARPVDDVQVRPIPGSEDGVQPFFSPDGASIGFFHAGDGTIKRIPASGGTATTVVRTTRFGGGSWGANNVIVYGGGAWLGLMRVSANGGEPTLLTARDSVANELRHVYPHFLPDGETVVFNRLLANGDSRIAITKLDGQARDLGLVGGAPRYASGFLFYGVAGTIRALPFDPRRGRITGEGNVVQQNVRAIGTLSPAGIWTVSPNGTLVFDAGLMTNRLALVDRTGRVELLSQEHRRFRMPRVSPDGNRIAVEVSGGPDETDIWLFDRRTTTLTRFTSGGGDTDVLWSPDGRWLAFSRTQPTGSTIIRQASDGSGVADTIISGPTGKWPWIWTPDGSTILYDEIAGQPTRIMSMPITGGTPRAVIEDAFVNRVPKLSPDGRWLAYASTEAGRFEVYVRPYPGPGGKVQISTVGGDQPMWSRDGKELYYRDGAKFIAVGIRTTPDIAVTSRTPLFDDHFVMSNATNYDVLRDGRFLMLQPLAEASQLFAVVNWQPPSARTTQ